MDAGGAGIKEGAGLRSSAPFPRDGESAESLKLLRISSGDCIAGSYLFYATESNSAIVLLNLGNDMVIAVRLTEDRQIGRVRRVAEFERRRVWWDIMGPDSLLPSPLTVHDAGATAIVHHAMKSGQALHVDGPVSRKLLECMDDYIACWAIWRPDLYKRIEVTAAEEIYSPPSPRAEGLAIAAFSGGVDASFTAHRHACGEAGRRSRKLQAAVLIQGLDIPLIAPEAFRLAQDSAAESLASINVPLITVQTNWKEIQVDWNMEFGLAVSSVLRHWAGDVSTGLLGSDEDYSRLVLPWGGNPLSYAQLSSDAFRVVYDGGEYARSEKVEYLTRWPSGMKNLRVCWAGPTTGRNCGLCEKCIRTKLNFMAVGAPVPLALGSRPPTTSEVRSMRATNFPQLALWQEIVTIAQERGVTGEWIDALKGAATVSKLRLRAAGNPFFAAAWRRVRALQNRVRWA